MRTVRILVQAEGTPLKAHAAPPPGGHPLLAGVAGTRRTAASPTTPIRHGIIAPRNRPAQTSTCDPTSAARVSTLDRMAHWILAHAGSPPLRPMPSVAPSR